MKTSIQVQFSAENYLRTLPESFTTLSKDEQRISLGIYKVLEQGKPVSVKDLAFTTSLDQKVILEALGKWPGIYYNDNKDIIGYWGLTFVEMPHKIVLADRTLYGWCAWDTLFIPQLLEKDVTIQSKDQFTNENVVIKMDQNGNIISDGQDIHVSLLFVDEADIRDDVVSSFCHFVHFFNTKRSGDSWVSTHDGTFLISLQEAVALSKRKNQLQYDHFIDSYLKRF